MLHIYGQFSGFIRHIIRNISDHRDKNNHPNTSYLNRNILYIYIK